MVRYFSKLAATVSICAALFCACGAQAAENARKTPIIRADNPEAAANYHGNTVKRYIMHGADTLQLSVFGHEDLSSLPDAPYVVRTDGYMTVPLIGDVFVAGRTVQDVTDEITQRLSEYVINPKVTINIIGMGSIRVYVLGEVNRQGVFELSRSHNLMDALAMAGGFNDYSAKKNIFVIRNGSQEASIKVNFASLLATGSPEANIELYDGDCVYLAGVGAKFWFDKNVSPWLAPLNTVLSTRRNYKDW